MCAADLHTFPEQKDSKSFHFVDMFLDGILGFSSTHQQPEKYILTMIFLGIKCYMKKPLCKNL